MWYIKVGIPIYFHNNPLPPCHQVICDQRNFVKLTYFSVLNWKKKEKKNESKFSRNKHLRVSEWALNLQSWKQITRVYMRSSTSSSFFSPSILYVVYSMSLCNIYLTVMKITFPHSYIYIYHSPWFFHIYPSRAHFHSSKKEKENRFSTNVPFWQFNLDVHLQDVLIHARIRKKKIKNTKSRRNERKTKKTQSILHHFHDNTK